MPKDLICLVLCMEVCVLSVVEIDKVSTISQSKNKVMVRDQLYALVTDWMLLEYEEQLATPVYEGGSQNFECFLL